MTQGLTYHQKYYLANKEKYLSRNKAWRDAHKDKMREYADKYWDKNKDKLLAKRARWYNKYREREKVSRLLRNHNITIDDYCELMAVNGGVCPICNRRPVAHIDHDHKTGDIRGMLCACCNSGLGKFEDGRLFDSAKQYLSRPPFKRSEK